MAFSAAAVAGPTALPDGRAYELVTPVEKGGSDAEPRGFLTEVGLAGEAESGLLYSTLNGLPGSEGAPLLVANVAKRGSDGWTNQPIAPPELNQLGIETGEPVIVSDNLEEALVVSKAPLTPDAPAGVNLYIRRTGKPGFELVTQRAIPNPILEANQVTYNPGNAVGASKNFSRVFFATEMPLTADSPQNVSAKKLYEFSNGTLSNVGILPGESSPMTGSLIPYRPILRPVSEDGSQVLFGAEPEVGGVTQPIQIFLRKNDAQTIEISKPEAGVVDPGGPKAAVLAGAAANGSSVYFTTESTLTADADTGHGSGGTTDLAPNLYRFDAATGDLTDLTIAPPTEELGADVKSALVSPSGEGVFFVAGGVLAPGASAGAENLYHWGQGEGISFVTHVESTDPIVADQSDPEAVTDSSGDAIAFVSTGGLAGQSAAAGVPDIYHWSVTEGLSCVSCGSGQSLTGAHLPAAGLALASGGNHPISADGTKVFFSTTDALVPQDSNGKEDVYEWEGGTDHLISSGSGNSGSYLIDASPSGKDVYFATRDQLVPADRDENVDIYDAREGGGFPLAPAPSPCEAEACRPPLSAAPAAPQLSSRVFNGPGNKKRKHHKKRTPKRHEKQHPARKCEAKAKRCSKQRKSHKAHSGGKRG
jgi:hypothetical protein